MAVKGEVDQKYVVIEEVNDSPRISRGVSLTSTRTRAVVNRATRLRSNWSQMARFLNITGVDADASEGGEEGDHMDQYLFGDSYFASPGVDVDETRSVATLAREWNLRNTVAFWSSVFYVVGSGLYVLGSVFLWPAVYFAMPSYKVRAWVSFPYMFGAWFYAVGGYLTYYQVINKEALACKDGGPVRFRFLAPIKLRNWGAVASVVNLMGSCIKVYIYTLTTLWPSSDKLDRYEHARAMMSAGGSLCFVVGSLLSGEYNGWRRRENMRKLSVWAAHLNFWSAIAFFVAVAANLDGAASKLCMGSTDIDGASKVGHVLY